MIRRRDNCDGCRGCCVLAAWFLCLVSCTPGYALRLEPTTRNEAFIGWLGESHVAQQGVSTHDKDKSWVETLSWEPRVFLYHNFLHADEADHLIQLARPYMKKSDVVDNDTGERVKSLSRTSSGHFLGRGEDYVVKAIEERIAEFAKFPVENGEPLHILHYQPTEKYDAHFDYFHDTVSVANGGQRVATVLMYLSDVEEGGETVFPNSKHKPTVEQKQSLSECAHAGMAVKPRKGDALLFFSLQADGEKDQQSLHGGCPVIRGSKWSATKWIRVSEHTAY